MLGKVCRAIHNRTVQALVQKLFGGRNSYHKTKPIAIEKKKRTSFTQDLTGSLIMLMQEIMNQVNTGTNRRTLIANSAVQNKLMNKQQNLTTSLLTIFRAVIRVVHLPTSNMIKSLVSNMGDNVEIKQLIWQLDTFDLIISVHI